MLPPLLILVPCKQDTLSKNTFYGKYTYLLQSKSFFTSGFNH